MNIFNMHSANDPNVPVTVDETPRPLPTPCPAFNVVGYVVGGTKPKEQQAAGVYSVISRGLNLTQALRQPPLTRWSRTSNLAIIPQAGRMLNAYYDGYSLRFFYDINPRTGKVVFTADSPDVISHELGHAVLDSWRPDLWTVQALEVGAFHESFGDMLSILTALTYDEIIDFIFAETGGDLRKANAVSRVAEELGSALSGRGDGLRNALNNYRYALPETLPRTGELTGEPHNFSKVFTGAFYDMLVLVYEKHGRTKDALRQARDDVGTCLFRGITHAAVTPRFFDSVVKSMIINETAWQGNCLEAINAAFNERNIIRITPFGFAGSTVRIADVETVKLADHMAAPANNPLYDVDIDIPSERRLEYNYLGMVQPTSTDNREESLSAAKASLDYLYATNRVSMNGEPGKEYSVEDGKLVRNFACSRYEPCS